MKSMNETKKQTEPDLAKRLAPEDITRGDYITVLDVIYEVPSYMWCCGSTYLKPHDVVRIALRSRDLGQPLKVKEICLPYVLVKTPQQRHQTIDVRGCRLVRLTRKFAKEVLKQTRIGTVPRCHTVSDD